MEQPQEIEDQEYERTWERVAAIDVAKGSGVVCTRVPDEDRPGRRKTHVWTVKATKRAVIELADHLRGLQIQVVTLESTSDYWRIWWVVLEAAGLKVQLVNARHVKNVPGRAKTGKKDAVWLAKLTGRGLLQPSFVPPPEIRRLREFTRLRTDLVRERTRYWARLEKLLERAQIKISAVLSKLTTDTARAMIEALIGGQRNPKVLAELAIGKARSKRGELAEALDGDWQPHHGELARILLDQIDALTAQVDALTDRVSELIDQIPAAWGVDAGGVTGPQAGTGPDAVILPALARLDEITGCGIIAAQAVIAEIGLDMTVFGTSGRLVSWARRSPQTRQSGKKTTTGRAGKGNPYLNGMLGEIAASASRTDTFLGERYRRLARRRGKRKALAAIARSILVIIFHLLADPTARFTDLGPGWYDNQIDAQRKTRGLIRQLEALGHTVTLTPAGAAAA
ncbi:MAG TPA: IS110 family transposase [Streptosporangiaceae bacterium]|nr:IS110 family transposase [Streptosporangiaceae bacterium]